MSTDRTDRALAILAALPPSISLDRVADWVARGRPQPKFHAAAWLSRVGPLPNN